MVVTNGQPHLSPRDVVEPLPWQNSTVLTGEPADAVAKLREDVDENLVVFGSGVLVRSLLPSS